MNYRPDIDGLRAIAVLSVILYHLDEVLLPGGFVGVDIFFVISGYLITKLIYKERSESGDFSYTRFYLRRVRRLFPALFATLLFCLVMSAKLFSPAHLVEFCESLIAAVFSVSNIYFWNIADYFDTQSSLKPLLHTWSLSVEEQFYFIWPLLMVTLYATSKRWAIPVCIIILGLASLLLNIWFFSEQATIINWFSGQDNQSSLDIQSTAFFWLPFRLFEFSLGAILLWIKVPKLVNRKLFNEAMFLVGLGFVLYSVVSFDSQMDYLSTWNLLPCLGAAMMILSGATHRLSWLLSNRLMVGIGLISYSLYLIHWPLIVYYKYWHFAELGLEDYLVLVAASFVLAWLMFRFIESPFRKPKTSDSNKAPNRRFVIGALASALIVCGVGVQTIVSKGWLWRYPDDVLAQLQYQQGDYTEFFWGNISALDGKSFENDESTTQQRKKILVVGDSMAADFINVLYAAGQNDKLDLSALKINHNCKSYLALDESQYQGIYGGAKEVCEKEHQRFLESPLLQQADTIVLASYWDLSTTHLVDSTALFLRETTTANVMVLGLKDQETNGIWFLHKHSFSAQTDRLRTPPSTTAVGINQRIESQASSYDYFDLMELFCENEGCQRVTKEGYVIIFDNSHFSENGASFVAQNLESASWYARLLQ